MHGIPAHICLDVCSRHLGVHCSRRVAVLSLAEELMQKVGHRILVYSTVGKKHVGLYLLLLLEPVDLHVVFDKFKNVHIRREITPLESIVQAKLPDKFLEDNVVIRHDLLPNGPGEAHHFADDVL